MPGIRALPDKELHIWSIDLKDHVASEITKQNVLSENENTRAKRFYQKRDRYLYTLSHTLLRLLLSQYSGQKPNLIKFKTTKDNKPSTDSIHPVLKHLEFNLSHSYESVLIAISTQPVGIDIEHISTIHSIQDLMKKIYSNDEIQYVLSGNIGSQKERFYKTWVAKEAYLKAIGTGLTDHLSEITTHTGKIELNSWQEMPKGLKNHEATFEKWRIQWLDVHSDYSAAVCIPQTQNTPEVRLFRAVDIEF